MHYENNNAGDCLLRDNDHQSNWFRCSREGKTKYILYYKKKWEQCYGQLARSLTTSQYPHERSKRSESLRVEILF